MFRRKQRVAAQQAEVTNGDTLFNLIGRDVCVTAIARHLDAVDINALMHTSKTTLRLFKNSKTFDLQKDVNAILQCVMRNDSEGFREQMLLAKRKYRGDFWRLLMVRTCGVESRGKRSEAISPIEFAVCAGSFSDKDEHNYLLLKMFYCIPLACRAEVLKHIENVAANGTMQFGEWRGVLSAIDDLVTRYNNYHVLYNYAGVLRANKYWREHVVPYQEKLPESVLQEMCRPIHWMPVPDFKNLSAPPTPALKVDGSEPFTRSRLTGRKWGIFHGYYSGAITAANGRVGDTRRVESDKDRSVLLKYSQDKKEQLQALLKEQWELAREHEAEKKGVSPTP